MYDYVHDEWVAELDGREGRRVQHVQLPLHPPLKSAGLQALCLGTRCGAGMDNIHTTLASCIVESCSAGLFEALISRTLCKISRGLKSNAPCLGNMSVLTIRWC
jgi:hypothetical protein